MKKIDGNLKVCFIGTYENEESHQALRDQFPLLEPECFVPKEARINDLIRRINAQLKNKVYYLLFIYAGRNGRGKALGLFQYGHHHWKKN